MAFDYKKEYKEFYLPSKTPGIVTVPAMENTPKNKAIRWISARAGSTMRSI